MGPQPEKAPPVPRSRPGRPNYPEDVRPTVSVKLRLMPEVALALRIAAATNKRTLSAHVTRLVETAGDPIASQHVSDPIADMSELAAAVHSVPRDVRRLESELARQGGLVKSLFLRPESLENAEAHSRECAAVLAGLLEASARASVAAEAVEARLLDVRESLRSGMQQIVDKVYPEHKNRFKRKGTSA